MPNPVPNDQAGAQGALHPYRTHDCGALRGGHAGERVRLSGWVHRKRDHGQLLFVDLRDSFGLTQCVIDVSSPLFKDLEATRVESVITVTGPVVERSAETVNPQIPTGQVEVRVEELAVRSRAEVLPLQVASEEEAGEDIRLRYRYLDLRRAVMQAKIRRRNDIVAAIRRRMWDGGFQEFQTPILTASSPEGARDFLVPSRLHPGRFYALPQAPQQFKQLVMCSGFDRYFQIAPCFRDEDSRADRLAEHYQLDVEMSFVTQDDVFSAMEPVLKGLFEEFGGGARVTEAPFPRLPYKEAMLRYGSDKPDLRNPLEIVDVTEVFARDDVEFKAFKGVIAKGGVVRAVRAPQVSERPRSFFDKLNDWARREGAPGLGYILFAGTAEATEAKGPIAKFVPAAAQDALRRAAGLESGDAVFFVCDLPGPAAKMAGLARDRICDEMDLREEGVFKFCWIVDFPMYELDEKTGKLDFSHNPFSMPQGGLEALSTADPLEVLAHQYDCVCNGNELCSGAIRNHEPATMEKAFRIVGYDPEEVKTRFAALYTAFQYGAPPHGGCAFGVDRIVMLLAGEDNLREVNAFVMNGQYEDLMMGAPSAPSDAQLKELWIKLDLPPE